MRGLNVLERGIDSCRIGSAFKVVKANERMYPFAQEKTVKARKPLRGDGHSSFADKCKKTLERNCRAVEQLLVME